MSEFVSNRFHVTSRVPSASCCSLMTGMKYLSLYHVVSLVPSGYVVVYPEHSISSPITVLVSVTSGSPPTSMSPM